MHHAQIVARRMLDQHRLVGAEEEGNREDCRRSPMRPITSRCRRRDGCPRAWFRNCSNMRALSAAPAKGNCRPAADARSQTIVGGGGRRGVARMHEHRDVEVGDQLEERLGCVLIRVMALMAGMTMTARASSSFTARSSSLSLSSPPPGTHVAIATNLSGCWSAFRQITVGAFERLDGPLTVLQKRR